MNKQRTIVALMTRYYELQDQLDPILFEQAGVKRKLLQVCRRFGHRSLGRYEAGTIFQVQKKLIQVAAHTRKAYIGFRRAHAPKAPVLRESAPRRPRKLKHFLAGPYRRA